MGLTIEGPNGKVVLVSDEGKMATESVSASVGHHVNHHNGKAFNLLFTATPTNSTNPFLYVKNTSEDDMVLEGFTLHFVASEWIDIKLGDVTGTPAGGTNITPANLNSGSGVIADGGSTGSFQNGNAITALSGGTVVQRIYHETSAGSTSYNFDQDIILKKNGVLTMYAETGGAALNGVLIFNYHNKEV